MRFVSSMLRLTPLAVVAFAAAPVRAADSPAQIHLRSEAEAVRTEVVLGDIARIDAGDPQTRRNLERVPICYAPVAGGARQVTRDYVLMKLQQQRVDLSRTDLTGANVVHILAVQSTIPPTDIVEAVTRALGEAMPWDLDQAAIVPPRTVRPLVVTARNPRLEVRFDPGEEFLGSTPARVHVYAGEELVHTETYRFHVALYRDVYVARTAISRGTLLVAEHVVTERVDVSQLGGRYIAAGDPLVGLRARRSVQIGTRLTPALVERPPAVDRGEHVRVRIQGDRFQISALGTAREAGAVGNIIRVDLPNRRRVQARVNAPGEVELIQ